ncbi:alpha-(1,3)-fucosyltransferase [Plakobranchus ocellatus]|uniref:Fucosyltransferase n=1 Tax=Plakobranchus ocellatus TaxID=259542 RepID=A0AAV3XU05_9GAST|nr:alpha-(1,3)-fucosyltransferase [Plakobranchus ocellatus]
MLPTVKNKHALLILLLTLTLLWICILQAETYFKQRIPANENPFPYARVISEETKMDSPSFSNSGEENEEEKSLSEEPGGQAKQERTEPDRDLSGGTKMDSPSFSNNGIENEEEESESEKPNSQAKQERTKPDRNLIVEPEFDDMSPTQDKTSENVEDDEPENDGVIESQENVETTKRKESAGNFVEDKDIDELASSDDSTFEDVDEKKKEKDEDIAARDHATDTVEEQKKPQPPAQSPATDRVYRIFDHNPIAKYEHVTYYNFSQCPYSRCEFTNFSRKADLLMVNAARIKNYPLPERRKGALLMMYTKEPPTFKRFHFLNSTDYMGSVNWTRSVFPGSTFMAHYRDIIQRAPPADKDYEAIFDQKRKEAAWFVTHCQTHSKREEYVKRMSRELRVDIYGACGSKSCGKYGFEMGGEKDVCLDLLRRDYKFYISFENSMCTGYITEKFFNMYEDVDVIPVVRGGGEYSEFAPKDTFVNAADFKTPEALGQYLRQLGQNKARYIEMLKKKDNYLSVKPREKFHCTLCKALHTRSHVPSVYPDFYKWMMDNCWKPTDL